MADIELVIKIPVETYEYWKNHSHEYVLAEAIKNGTQLPKGHGRLIDADKFINDFACYGYTEAMNVDYFRAVVPTIIEADKAESEDKDEDSI